MAWMEWILVSLILTGITEERVIDWFLLNKEGMDAAWRKSPLPLRCVFLFGSF